MESHIHTPDDGRGRRMVIINNHEIKDIFYADIKKGIALQYRRNKQGDFILNHITGQIRYRRLRGSIKILSDNPIILKGTFEFK